MIPFRDAQKVIRDAVKSPCPTESLSLYDAAGRVLRKPVQAERSAPPFDRVMMDGFALKASSWTAGKSLSIQDRISAGERPPERIRPQAAMEVMTGGVLPPGCDTVVPVEWCECMDGNVRVTPPGSTSLREGQFIHREGSDGKAGREVLSVGQRLGPAELAVAATEGAVSLEVNRLPRIHLITTGDEIVPPEKHPGPQHIRGSHAVALSAMIHDSVGSVVVHHHAADRRDVLQNLIAETLPICDLLLLTGGVSKGKKDYVPDLLDKTGVTRHFHRVAQQPGRPLWFGMKGATAVFGLPGNPISALVSTRMLVLSFLDHWRGTRPRPPIRGEMDALPPRSDRLTLFVPLHRNADGDWAAHIPSTSGSLHSLCDTQGLAECPPDPEECPKIHLWNPSV